MVRVGERPEHQSFTKPGNRSFNSASGPSCAGRPRGRGRARTSAGLPPAVPPSARIFPTGCGPPSSRACRRRARGGVRPRPHGRQHRNSLGQFEPAEIVMGNRFHSSSAWVTRSECMPYCGLTAAILQRGARGPARCGGRACAKSRNALASRHLSARLSPWPTCFTARITSAPPSHELFATIARRMIC